MKSPLILGIAVAVALSGAALLAQDKHEAKSDMQGIGKDKHREMMPVHAKLQEAQDVEIDKLAAEMNAGTGEKRVDAIVAVVNKLIEQRKAMH